MSMRETDLMRLAHSCRSMCRAWLGVAHDFAEASSVVMPFVKLDYSGDADDFPLESGDPLVSRYF